MEFSVQYTYADFREASAAVRKPVGPGHGRTERIVVLIGTFVLLIALFITAGLANTKDASGKIIPGFWATFAVSFIPDVIIFGVAWAVLVPRLEGLSRRATRNTFIIFLLAMVAFSLLLARNQVEAPIVESASTSSTAGLDLLPFGILILGIWIGIYQYLRSLRRAAWEKQPHLRLVHRISFSEDGVTVENDRWRTIYQWSAFLCYCETSKLFVLQRSRMSFEMIPKRCVGEGSQIESLRNLLDQRVTRAGQRLTAFPVVPMHQAPRMVEPLSSRTMY
jgi:YcxB-like protein